MMLPTLNIFNSKAATGTGTAHVVEAYDKAVFSVKTANSANFTLKFQGSWEGTKPDFSASSTATNPWIYLNTVNRDTGASVGGTTTAVTSAGTDVIMNYEVNGALPRWICATVTAYVAGNITVDLIPQHLYTTQA